MSLAHKTIPTTDDLATDMAPLQAAVKESTVLIAVVVSSVARDFLSLADALTAEGNFAAQVSPTSIQDEFGRFKVCGNHLRLASPDDARCGRATSQRTDGVEDLLSTGTRPSAESSCNSSDDLDSVMLVT